MLTDQIRQAGLLEPGGRYVIALSGGCDSLCLLFLMHALGESEGYALLAVHVHHGLRREADEDEAFCIQRCTDLGIPLVVYREDIREEARRRGMGLEECGRLIRYERLKEAAADFQAKAVLTAHHRDDQAETLLLHLLRGSGLPGLAGMKRIRALTDSISLIRPLLDIPRSELEAYLRERGESWREDASNQSRQYSRNALRLEILPAMETIFPQASRHLADSAAHAAEVHAYMEEEAAAWLSRHQAGNTLQTAALGAVHPALQTYIWRTLLEKSGLADVNETHFNALKSLPVAPSGTLIQLPGNRQVLREQESLRLLWEAPAVEEATPVFTMRTFPWENKAEIPNTPYTKWIDYAIIKNNPALRHRQPGDYIYIAGGKKKSLSRFLVDEKVPLGLRDSLWLLADGSHVLWVVGHRLSHRARITEKTETVAQITVTL